MNRREHVLPRKKQKTPKFFAFDCEGDGANFRGCAFYWGDGALFAETRGKALGAWTELRNAGFKVAVAHNAGYDIGVLFPQPFPPELQIELIGDGAFLNARWDGVTIWDSMNLANMPLWQVGQTLGLPKFAPPWWVQEDMDRATEAEKEALTWRGCNLESYAIRDAEIVYRLTERFGHWADLHGVTLSGRAATMAVNCWLTMPTLPVPRADAIEQAWGRAALYPGRAEVYQQGHHDWVETWDVNSMYPWAMTLGVPDPRGAWDSPTWPQGIVSWGIVDATVEVPAKTFLPVLPCRHGDEVYYPTGRFRGVWTTIELAAAMDRGTELVKCHGARFYRRLIHPFDDFVDEIYGERLSARRRGDAVTELFSKRILNSLWGRLALKPSGVKRIIRADSWEPAPCGHCQFCRRQATCERLRDLKREGPYWLVGQYKGQQPDYVNPTWAAWITANARLRLLELMENVPTDWLVRTHTDSVTVKPEKYAITPWHPSDEIGALKLEYEGPLDVWAPSIILRSDGGRAAGVPRENAREYLETGHVQIRHAKTLLEGLATAESSIWEHVDIKGLKWNETRADGGKRAMTIEEIRRKT